MERKCCTSKNYTLEGFFEKKDGKHCYVSDSNLIGSIKKKEDEIAAGASEILTCDTYDAIKTNAPHMVFSLTTKGQKKL